jgi:hypothetical protein
MPPVHECPTQLHQDDRIVLVEGFIVFSLGSLVWLLGLVTAGLFVALIPPAAFRAVLPFLPGGWEPPLAGRAVAFAVFAVLGAWLSLWHPAGHDPLAYALIRLRHRLTPEQAVWHPAAAYDPPAPAAAAPAPGGDEENKEYAWSD